MNTQFTIIALDVTFKDIQFPIMIGLMKMKSNSS